MDKRFIFLHDFKFPISTFKEVYLQVVSQCLDDSKFAKDREELINLLDTTLSPILNRFTESKIPLISVILRNAYNYCQLLDQHSDKNMVAKLLFTEMTDCLESALEAYLIAIESNYEYNHYCSNSINYRLEKYRNRLEYTIKLTETLYG